MARRAFHAERWRVGAQTDVGAAQQRRPLEPHGIEHRAQVVRLLFELEANKSAADPGNR
jgi:hypothetical protein